MNFDIRDLYPCWECGVILLVDRIKDFEREVDYYGIHITFTCPVCKAKNNGVE